FEWALANGDGEDALNLMNASGYFLQNRGQFTQAIGWAERVVERLNDHPDKLVWANAQNSLAVFYQEHPTGNHRDNLKRAIGCYEAALVYRTPQAAPQDYATTQNNLGIAYRNLSAIEDRADNLKRAIGC